MRDAISFRSSADVSRIHASEAEIAAPVEPSPRSKPPQLTPVPPRRPRLSYAAWALIAAAAVLAVAGWVALRPYFSQSPAAALAETTVVRTEDFVKVVRLSGTTAAVHSRPILVPTLEGAQLSELVITKIKPAGAHVKKGDLLAEFDRQAQLKDALDKRAAYQNLVDQLDQKRAAEVAARAKDETDLTQADDALKKAQLEVSKSDIVSRIDAEKNRETLEEAIATLKQLQQTFKLKRQSGAADIRSMAIQADRAKETMLYAESNAQKMRLVSPMDGVVVLNTIWKNGRMGDAEEGDSVRSGMPFMRVVDPSRMNVTVEVNQADFLTLHPGQQARIHLDAYPDLVFAGALVELSPLAHTSDFSDKVRTFTATFAIDGSSPRLMPDLSAAVDVALDSVKNAVVVPVQSVEPDGGREYVWIQDGSRFEKRTVKVGPRNDLNVVIESGLKSGDVVKRDASGAASAGVS